MKKSTIKNILIIGGIIIAVFVVYVVFIKPSPADNQTGTLRSSTGAAQPAANPATVQANASTNELLNILTSLQSLDLNDSILFNPAFDALQDISMPLIREGNQGRRNPFAALGSDPIIIDITPDEVEASSNRASAERGTSPTAETTGDTETDEGQDIFGLPSGT